MPNKEALKQTIILAKALGCKINNPFWFDRKNYFYHDLAKGYQISQHFKPIGVDGKLQNFALWDIHLEEDTGKSLHFKEKTLVDFNRSGVPLVEIVSAPVMHSVEEAKAFCKRIQQLVRYLGFSDCDMEKGSMRLEANVSVQRLPARKCYALGVAGGKGSKVKKLEEKDLPNYRVEVKNINSFRFLERAINYEIKRQTEILQKGETPRQETRGFDISKGETFSQRGKETAKDYRYFPEPDLPAFCLTEKELSDLKPKDEDLPWKMEEKIIALEIRNDYAQIISQNKKTALLFLKFISSHSCDPAKAAKVFVNKKVNEKTDEKLLTQLMEKEVNRFSIVDEGELKKIIAEVIAANPKPVADYKSGKQAAIGFLIGQVQRKLAGKADPNLTRKLLEDFLKN